MEVAKPTLPKFRRWFVDIESAFNLIAQVTGEVQASRAVHEKIVQALKILKQHIEPEAVLPVAEVTED